MEILGIIIATYLIVHAFVQVWYQDERTGNR